LWKTETEHSYKQNHFMLLFYILFCSKQYLHIKWQPVKKSNLLI